MTDVPGDETPDEPRAEGDDPVLGADLRSVVTDLYGSLPDDVLAAARGAWTWRTVDAELAELLEEESLAVRSDTAVTGPFAFAAEGVIIDVEHEGPTVLGQVGGAEGEPLGASVVVEIAGADGTRHVVEADVDAAGGFRAAVPDGRARVAVTLPDGRRIVTPWLPS